MLSLPDLSIVKWKVVSGDREIHSLIWRDLATHMVEAFCWLAVVGKVATVDNLRRSGMLFGVLW